MKQAIVLGTGVVALGTISAYASVGIRVVHLSFKKNDIASYSRFSSETHVVPAPLQADTELLSFLMNATLDWSRSLLDPVNDPGVVFCSTHHEILSKRYVVTVPRWKILKGIINKSDLYLRAHEIGVPAPIIRKFISLDELEKTAKHLHYPCIIKPDQTPDFFAQYSKKVLVANDPESLVNQYQDVLAHDLDVMVSEIIPGDETQYFLYVCHLDEYGNVLAEVCIQKIRQHPAEYGVGSVIITIPMISEVRDASVKLLRDYGYTGFSATEYKWDYRDEKYKLIEINTRQVLYVNLLEKIGINFCELMYLDKVEDTRIMREKYQEGVYWIHPFQEIREYRARRRLPGFSFKSFFRPMFSLHKVFALSLLSDPMPFLKSLSKFIRSVFNNKKVAGR